MKVLCIPAFKRAEKGTSGHYKKLAARMLCSDVFLLNLFCQNADWSTKEQTGARQKLKVQIYLVCLKKLF